MTMPSFRRLDPIIPLGAAVGVLASPWLRLPTGRGGAFRWTIRGSAKGGRGVDTLGEGLDLFESIGRPIGENDEGPRLAGARLS